jgi:hypothetical protein
MMESNPARSFRFPDESGFTNAILRWVIFLNWMRLRSGTLLKEWTYPTTLKVTSLRRDNIRMRQKTAPSNIEMNFITEVEIYFLKDF